MFNVYDEDTGKLAMQQIKRMDLNFSSTQITTIYTEHAESQFVEAFNYDQARHKLLLVNRDLRDGEDAEPVYMFKLFDLNKLEMEHEMVIE